MVPFTIALFWAEKDRWLKWISLGSLGAMIQGLMQLGSRATYLSVAGAVGLLSVWNIRRKSLWFLAILGLIFMTFFVPAQVKMEFMSIFDDVASQGEGAHSSVAGRYQFLEWGIELFWEKPMFGWGPGQFNHVIQR